MISPTFVHVAQINPIKLKQLIGLQLATIGSCSKVNIRENLLYRMNDIDLNLVTLKILGFYHSPLLI